VAAADGQPARGTAVRESAVHDAVAGLTPGYFALVMGTGIVSVGLRSARLTALSVALLWIALVSYSVLIVLTAWRAVAYRAELRADVTNPRTSFGFFSFVAATDVLGARLALDGHTGAAFALLAVGVLSWLVLGYAVPWIVVLGRQDHPLLAFANGTWFILVVATESVAVLAATLEPTVGPGRRELALLAVFAWSVGVFLYGAIAILITTRLLQYPFQPVDLTPPYWVAMGATAITVLAGARIVEMADAPMVLVTRELIAGAAVVFWAFGSWLIPLLVAAGWWRHVTHRVPLRYEAPLWSMVFPLGMYGVASIYLGRADHLDIVAGVGKVESWVALAVWGVVFVAMLRHLMTTLVLRPRSSASGDAIPAADGGGEAQLG
jgi:tellurite resistance protein TehA-like permease